MNGTIVTTVNTKGQVVIPKRMREVLGITPEVSLEIAMIDNTITISPITARISKAERRKRLLEILELTRGAWGPETPEDKKREAARRKLELAATKRNKAAW